MRPLFAPSGGRLVSRGISAAFILAIVLGTLSGCLESVPETPEAPLPDDPGVPGIVALDGTPDSLDENATWGRLVVRAEGPPGSWLLVAHPFAKPAPQVEYEYEIEGHAQGSGGEPLALLMSKPQLMMEGNGTFTDDVRLHVDRSGESVQGHFSGTREFNLLTGQNLTGLYMAFGSTGQWRVEATIDIGPGNSTGPGLMSMGSGAELAMAVEELPVALDSAGSIRTELPIAGDSWTHIEVFWDPLVSEQVNPHVRRCELSFGPGPFECTSRGIRPYESVWGRRAQAPATAYLEMEYVVASSDYDAAIFSIPVPPDAWPREAVVGFDYIQEKGSDLLWNTSHG